MLALARGCILTVTACALGSTLSAQPPIAPDSLDSAIYRSQFIFIATLHRLGPALDDLQPGPFAGTMTVDTAVRVPPSVGAIRDTVMISLSDTSGLVIGARYAVYATGLSAGRTLVLSALAIRRGYVIPDSVTSLIALTRAADERVADRLYWARYDSVSVVATGVVQSVEAVTVDNVPAVRFESGPLWLRAFVRVVRLYKGPPVLGSTGLTVLFPGSREIAYRRLTPLAPGQTRLLSLQTLGVLPAYLRAGLDPTRTYVLIDSLDNVSAGDTARINRRP